jgi:predicted permease
MNDLKYAFRQLIKRPGFTAVAVLTLALGIGANTAIFSVVDGVLIRPAPFENADRLAMVWETDRNSGTMREPASVPDFLDFEERASTFEQLAAFNASETNLVPDQGEPQRLAVSRVTFDFLPLVGVQPLLGRTFAAEDDRAGAPTVCLISEGLWERLFARDPDALGRTLNLDGVAVPIVGVLPGHADFGTLQILGQAAYQRSFADRVERTDVEVWLPLQPDPEALPRNTHPIFVLGRLEPGATVGAAQKEMSTITAELEEIYPENDARGANVEALTDVVFGPVRPALYLLLAAVALVLLVACVNVANLLLARGTARMRDVAVRTALGADARRLARQFLVEGIVLAVAGGALGVLLAIWGTQALLALAPQDVPRIGAVGIDGRVLAATLLLSLVVGVAFGLVPTLQSRSVNLQAALKTETAASVSGGRRRTNVRAGLVVLEVALAVMVVVGAGLLIKSFWRLQQVDPGFRAERVLKAEFQLPRSRYPVDFSVYPDFREMHAFNAELLERLTNLPGVEAAAIAGTSPLDAGFQNSFAVVGREAEAADWPEISVRQITRGYLETVGLSLLRGRGLGDSDGTAAVPVLLINQAAAQRFFPSGDPLGEQIALWGAARTIVGVVGNERFHGLSEPAPPAIYLPLAQAPSVSGAEAILVRTSGRPANLVAEVRSTIRALDPQLAVFGVEPLAQTVSRSVGQQRFTMLLLATFAAVAILLAAVGVHGVLSYMVARRTREMGLRMALGALRRDVTTLIVREGLRLAAVGLALGLLAAAASARLLRALLFGVSETDPLTFVAVAIVVMAVAVSASYLSALRATRGDPVEALRYE